MNMHVDNAYLRQAVLHHLHTAQVCQMTHCGIEDISTQAIALQERSVNLNLPKLYNFSI